mmetsp:Transcript_9387/g.17633  ORF Transcript_9387/g.17633 Transcript_9387/m.17633 type:complete len:119 (-) Transcript_9387:219-575(-)
MHLMGQEVKKKKKGCQKWWRKRSMADGTEVWDKVWRVRNTLWAVGGATRAPSEEEGVPLPCPSACLVMAPHCPNTLDAFFRDKQGRTHTRTLLQYCTRMWALAPASDAATLGLQSLGE